MPRKTPKQDARSNKPAHERNADTNGSRRYRLRADEIKLLEEYRRIKETSEAQGINPQDVKHGWIKSDDASLFFTNPNYKDETQKAFEALKDSLIEEFSKYSPTYPKVKRKRTKHPHLLVVDPADVHIGKLCSSFETGQDYNQQIAVQRVKEGVQGILDKTTGYNFDKILFVIGNDILHTDTPQRKTTSGTPQDTDGMWYENFLTGVQLYADVITTLMQVADVHVTYNPSNHDYTNGFFLAQLIETHFRQSKNVTFDCSISHRKYYTYGLNLIGTTHGDGAKTMDLPLLMAHEATDWTKCKHRYIYTHHVHHKTSKDVMSVCVESLRSPSGTDSWHHRNGYQHAPKAIEGYIHHPNYGQIARITHLF